MGKICPNCKKVVDDNFRYCDSCGTKLETSAINDEELNTSTASNPVSVSSNTSNSSEISLEISLKGKKNMLLIILGFVSSIIGVFCFSVILLPLGACLSLAGLIKSEEFKGLAISGTIISIIGIVLKIAIELYQHNLIPEWLYSGVF